MPFDGATYEHHIQADHRARLAARLREGVPDWDFTNPYRCALAVAAGMGMAVETNSWLRATFGITRAQATAIFGVGRYRNELRPNTMTPDMVADALDQVTADQAAALCGLRAEAVHVDDPEGDALSTLRAVMETALVDCWALR